MNNKKENGYTLLEMIITIALIGIAISATGFGLNTVFEANVNSYSNELANEIRLTQTREMASKDDDYRVLISYDSIEGQYIVTSIVRYDSDNDHSPDTDRTTKVIKLPKSAKIEKDEGAGFNELRTFPANSGVFIFDPIYGGLTSDGAGNYRITSTQSNKVFTFQVVKENGRVYVDD